MTAPYRYNCTDKSILLPHYKKYIVAPAFRLVPRWLTANFITILSTGFIVAMMIAAVMYEAPGSPVLAAIFGICMKLYLLGDHLDGMQAKESKTSSPLGEFLDHYLDVFNGAIVFYTITVFLGSFPDHLFLVLMGFSCAAFAATMVEELETRMLVFGYIGTLEGVLLLILIYLIWLIPGVKELWYKELIPGYPAFWIIIIGTGLGYLGTVLDILIRMGRFPKPFALFCVLLSVLVYLLMVHPTNRFLSWAILILFSADYIARVMQSYLLERQHLFPDWISSLLLLFILVADLAGWLRPELWASLSAALLVWLLVKMVFSFSTTVYELREHWHWINP